MSDMKNKVCLVTGATNGVGRYTALGLAKMGAEVIVHGRNPALVETVTAELRKESGNSAISGMVADFGSLADVRQLATQVSARYPRLDVLLNNAGTGIPDRRRTKDGYEWHVGVNYLAPVLLTQLLLGPLKAAGSARVVSVSSTAHKGSKLDIDDFNFEKGYTFITAYTRTKLMLVLYFTELARRLAGEGITVNTLHPGVVATNIVDGMPFPMNWIGKAMKPFFLTPAKGAVNSIYVASSPEVANVTGKYFEKCHAVAADPRINDAELTARLWQKTEQLLAMKLG